jgi:hypothetical protein
MRGKDEVNKVMDSREMWVQMEERLGGPIPGVPGTGVRVFAGLRIPTLTLTPLYPTRNPPGFTLPVTIPNGS